MTQVKTDKDQIYARLCLYVTGLHNTSIHRPGSKCGTQQLQHRKTDPLSFRMLLQALGGPLSEELALQTFLSWSYPVLPVPRSMCAA